jgi:hypothetical protein
MIVENVPQPRGVNEYRVGSLSAVQSGEPILADAGGTEVALFMRKVLCTKVRLKTAR